MPGCVRKLTYKPGPHAQVHGSAPDIAGQDIANPMAMVLSAAMMCRYGLDLPAVSTPVGLDLGVCCWPELLCLSSPVIMSFLPFANVRLTAGGRAAGRRCHCCSRCRIPNKGPHVRGEAGGWLPGARRPTAVFHGEVRQCARKNANAYRESMLFSIVFTLHGQFAGNAASDRTVSIDKYP